MLKQPLTAVNVDATVIRDRFECVRRTICELDDGIPPADYKASECRHLSRDGSVKAEILCVEHDNMQQAPHVTIGDKGIPEANTGKTFFRSE